MYYSAYDLQCNCWFSTGRNSRTKKQCVKEITAYLIEDDVKAWKKIPELEIIESFEVEIVSHAKRINEDY